MLAFSKRCHSISVVSDTAHGAIDVVCPGRRLYVDAPAHTAPCRLAVRATSLCTGRTALALARGCGTLE
jgi:hypothetical protein